LAKDVYEIKGGVRRHVPKLIYAANAYMRLANKKSKRRIEMKRKWRKKSRIEINFSKLEISAELIIVKWK
jgi:hypothetical protein